MNKLIAIIRKPDASILNCELTHITRDPINLDKLYDQHKAYGSLLESLGVRVIELPALKNFPDAVFVEDTTIILDEVAIITRPGAVSRRAELESIIPIIQSQRKMILQINEPGILDGGDVMLVEKTLYVGLSTRTNQEAVDQLVSHLKPLGYKVRTIPVNHSLHLKTAVSYLGKNTILLNPDWVDVSLFSDFCLLGTSDSEPFGANALLIGDKIIHTGSHPKTTEKLRAAGFDVVTISISELAKAEAGLTCLSLIFNDL